MNRAQIFEELNIAYRSLIENEESTSENKDTKHLESKACSAFFQKYKQLFKIPNCSLLDVKTSDIKSLEDNLVTLCGYIVDIFEPEITDVVNIANGEHLYSLYGQLAPQSHFDLLNSCNDIEHTEYRDITALLLFLDTPVKNDFNNDETLHDINSNLIKLNNKFPIIVYTFEDREKFLIGQKIQVNGFLTLDKYEEPESTNNNKIEEEHNKGFRDCYLPDKVYSVYSFEMIINPTVQYIDSLHLENSLMILKTNLLNIFKDRDAVTVFLIGLISKNYHKSGTEPLEYMNINIFNITPDLLSKLMEFISICEIDNQLLRIDHEMLKDDILAEHDTNFGIMKLNKIYPGTNTNYLISELGLSEGQLTQKATLNILKIKEMIEHKQIWVNFYQSMIKFDLNTAVIGLSSGKSIFPYDLKYKLNSTNDIIIDELSCENQQFNDLKLAIMQLQQNLKDITIEDLECIKDKYVEARRNDKTFTQMDFSKILKMAKHIACLELTNVVDTKIYEEAERLYLKMKEYLS